MGGSNSVEITGVRVFKVIGGSPAAEAGLEVFFDFILEINGVKMDPQGQTRFAKVIQDAENGAAKLQVFNTRSHTTREVIIYPRKWAGTGLLGATVRYDMVDPHENHGVRVLEVFPNSPAAHSGLIPYQDFLLGTSSTVFHDIDELQEVVAANLNQKLQVYVYNTDSEGVREVTMAPNNEWGGEGCIGCDISTGLLHRIPPPRRMPGGMAPMSAPVGPPAVPGGQQFLPPAGVPQPSYPPGVQMPVPAQPGTMPVPGIPQAMPPQAMPGFMQPQAVPPPAMPPGVPAFTQPQAMPAPVPAYTAAPAPAAVPAVAAPTATMPATAPVAAVPAPMIPVVPPAVPTPAIPAPVPVVPTPVPATAPAATSAQVNELAALQARIAALGAAPGAAAPGAAAVPSLPPQALAQPQVAGMTWPPQPAQPAPPVQEFAAQSPTPSLPAAALQFPPSSPAAAVGGMASPITPAADLPRAPPGTPINPADAVQPAALDKAMDAASFAPAGTPPGGAALL